MICVRCRIVGVQLNCVVGDVVLVMLCNLCWLGKAEGGGRRWFVRRRCALELECVGVRGIQLIYYGERSVRPR